MGLNSFKFISPVCPTAVLALNTIREVPESLCVSERLWENVSLMDSLLNKLSVFLIYNIYSSLTLCDVFSVLKEGLKAYNYPLINASLNQSTFCYNTGSTIPLRFIHFKSPGCLNRNPGLTVWCFSSVRLKGFTSAPPEEKWREWIPSDKPDSSCASQSCKKSVAHNAIE